MTEDGLDKEVRRGDEAARLLDSQLLNEVLDEMERQTIDLWEGTPARDTEGREHLHRFYLACRKFRNVLKNYLDTGKMARIQLNQRKQKQQ